MIQALNKLLAPLRQRILNLVARAVVSGIDDSQKLQLLQLGVLSDETRESVERFQNYGFTSHPQSGAESIVLFAGGSREHGLAICVDDRQYRLRNLESGEVAIYDHQGSKVVLKANGNIEVSPAAGVVVNGTTIQVGGAAEAAIKGTSYIAAESTVMTAIGAFATSCGSTLSAFPAIATAATTLNTAIGVFATAANSAKSTKVTVG